MNAACTESLWDIIGAIGGWLSAIAAFVAVYVALYVNHDAKSPQVVAFLEHDQDHGCMIFAVANYGNGIARNIAISGFDYSLVMETLRSKAEASFISDGIPLLVPGASRRTIILAGSEMKSFSDRNAIVEISYESKGFPFGMKRTTEKFVLDYKSFSESVYTDSDEHRIAVAVEKIAEAKG